MRKLHLHILPVIILHQLVRAQDTVAPRLWFSAYAEAYYSAAPAQPSSKQLPDFIYNHSRINVPDLNLALVNLKHQAAITRGSLALAAGSYVNRNMSAERFPFSHVFELNAGLRLSGQHDIWVDAGILPSHIGFESALSKNCWTFTRSIAADNSPYYETGVRLAGTLAGHRLRYALLLLNGWQTVTLPFTRSNLAFGTQLNYKPGKRIEINWSTYAGTDERTNPALPRIFNNFYLICDLNSRLACTLGFDLGLQQKAQGESYQNWYSPQLILRYRLSPTLSLSVRAEQYTDRQGIVIQSPLSKGFICSAFSGNLDYAPFEQLLLRAEAKYMHGSKGAFKTPKNEGAGNFTATIGLALSF